MLTPITKINILRIIPYGFIWLSFSLVYSVMEKGLLGDLDTYPSTGNPYDFASNIFITAFTALISGLLIGTIETLYLSKLFTEKGFLKKVVYKTLIYIGIMITFLLLTTLISNSFRLDSNVFDPRCGIRYGYSLTTLLSGVLRFI